VFVRERVTSLLFTLRGSNVNSVCVCVCVCERESDFTSVHTAWV